MSDRVHTRTQVTRNRVYITTVTSPAKPKGIKEPGLRPERFTVLTDYRNRTRKTLGAQKIVLICSSSKMVTLGSVYTLAGHSFAELVSTMALYRTKKALVVVNSICPKPNTS